MKKILVLVTFLWLVAAACTMQPSNNNGATSNANTSMPKAPMVSDAEIIAKEKSGWDAIKKKDWDALGKMLTSDFIDVEDDGVFDKAGSIASLKDFDLADVTFSDWKTLPIDKDAVIVTYSLNEKATYKGQAVPPGPYHAAAAYVNRDGQWLGIYYQQTLTQTAPPPPSPTASQPAKTAASPAAKPGETGSDPIANEKIVWDTFKSKNYDAFANLLAPEFVEIEAVGVYDKAGSVKGVKDFDASQYELSEWKAVKFDNDAALVTYMIKGTGANKDQERHTSIWANRNGKWLALFHQGTPVAMPEPKK
jgi:hypothetical protein